MPSPHVNTDLEWEELYPNIIYIDRSKYYHKTCIRFDRVTDSTTPYMNKEQRQIENMFQLRLYFAVSKHQLDVLDSDQFAILVKIVCNYQKMKTTTIIEHN